MEIISGELRPITAEIRVLAAAKGELVKDVRWLKTWAGELWGNGKGDPNAFLTQARREDKAELSELKRMMQEQTIDKARKEGYESGQRDALGNAYKTRKEFREVWTLRTAVTICIASLLSMGLGGFIVKIFHLFGQ